MATASIAAAGGLEPQLEPGAGGDGGERVLDQDGHRPTRPSGTASWSCPRSRLAGTFTTGICSSIHALHIAAAAERRHWSARLLGRRAHQGRLACGNTSARASGTTPAAGAATASRTMASAAAARPPARRPRCYLSPSPCCTRRSTWIVAVLRHRQRVLLALAMLCKTRNPSRATERTTSTAEDRTVTTSTLADEIIAAAKNVGQRTEDGAEHERREADASRRK